MDNQILTEILENQKLMFNEIKDLKSDVSSLKSDVSSLKSDVSSLKSDVSFLKSDVSSLKSEQQKTNQRLDNIESDVKHIKNTQREHLIITQSIFDQTANLTEFKTEANNNFKEIYNILKIHSHEIDKIKASL